MTVDELVKLNNEKRKLLTEENEAYYTDLVVYLRMKWRLSEQQTEEVLMEMLDHLLDAQKEGKSAAEVFGDEPLQFADSLIAEIADENPLNWVEFFGKLILQLLGWIFVIRGAIIMLFSFFTEVKETVYMLQAAVFATTISLFIIFNIWFMLKTVKKNLFVFPKEKKRERKASMQVGLAAGLSMLVLLLIIKFTPEMGPTFHFPAYLSLVLGGIMLLVHHFLKKI